MIACIWHVMRKEIFKFEVLIPNEPIKTKMAAKKLQNGCQRAQNRNIFTKNNLKFEFKVVIFYWFVVFTHVLIMYNQICYYYTKTASKKNSKWLPNVQNGCQRA